MARTNVYRTDEMTGEKTLEGYFDPNRSEQFTEATRWDGNTNRGVISGLQCGHECLHRTAGGRWVRHYDATSEFNGPEFYEFLTDEQAKNWLLRSEVNDSAIKEFFGTLTDEEGPSVGRPAIGPAVPVRLPADLRARIDAAAANEGVSVAEWIRTAAEQRLGLVAAG